MKLSPFAPLSCSGPDVRLLRAGAKTQHRVPFRAPVPLGVTHWQYRAADGHWWPMHGDPADIRTWSFAGAPLTRQGRRCPYGAPGTRLWVRETWAQPWSSGQGHPVIYRATYEHPEEASASAGPWRSSTSMPRWASRFTLVVEEIRVERLQAICEADARSEGVELLPCTYAGQCNSNRCPRHGVLDPYRTAYRAHVEQKTQLGPYAWDANPWVWALTFRVEQPGPLE